MTSGSMTKRNKEAQSVTQFRFHMLIFFLPPILLVPACCVASPRERERKKSESVREKLMTEREREKKS